MKMSKMKAVLGYHYPSNKWCLIDIMVGPLSAGADTYKKLQIDKDIFTEFVEAPIRSIDADGGVVTHAGYRLPKVLTLRQSIKQNIKNLNIYLSKI